MSSLSNIKNPKDEDISKKIRYLRFQLQIKQVKISIQNQKNAKQKSYKT